MYYFSKIQELCSSFLVYNIVNAQAKFLTNSYKDTVTVGAGAGFETASGRDPQTRLIDSVIRLVYFSLSFLGVITLLIILYAGFLWMTAGGDQEQIGQSKKWLINGVIGLILILTAYSVTLLVSKYVIQSSQSRPELFNSF